MLRLFNGDGCFPFLISHLLIHLLQFDLHPHHATLDALLKAPIIFTSPIHEEGFIQGVYARGVRNPMGQPITLYSTVPCFKLNILENSYFPQLTPFSTSPFKKTRQWQKLLALSQGPNASFFIETKFTSTTGGITEFCSQVQGHLENKDHFSQLPLQLGVAIDNFPDNRM